MTISPELSVKVVKWGVGVVLACACVSAFLYTDRGRMEVGHGGIPMGPLLIGIPMLVLLAVGGLIAIYVTHKIRKSYPMWIWTLRLGWVLVFVISWSWLKESLSLALI